MGRVVFCPTHVNTWTGSLTDSEGRRENGDSSNPFPNPK